jgi:hypothetical protein
MLNKLKDFAKNFKSVCGSINDEKTTLNVLVEPFFKLLGYNALIVDAAPKTPSGKKLKAINLILKPDDDCLTIVNCSKCLAPLGFDEYSCLERSFQVLFSKRRVAILTNGLEYKFYSDLERPDSLDRNPFFTINVLEADRRKAETLTHFHENAFNWASFIANAAENKRRAWVEMTLESYMEDPPDALVDKVLYDAGLNINRSVEKFGVYRELIIESFGGIVKKHVNCLLAETIRRTFPVNLLTEALKQVLNSSEAEPKKSRKSGAGKKEAKGDGASDADKDKDDEEDPFVY